MFIPPPPLPPPPATPPTVHTDKGGRTEGRERGKGERVEEGRRGIEATTAQHGRAHSRVAEEQATDAPPPSTHPRNPKTDVATAPWEAGTTERDRQQRQKERHTQHTQK